MRSEDPKAVMFPPESLHCRSFRQIPHSDGLVLSATNDQFMFRMENRARDVVEMSPARIHLPRLRFAHPPELDLPIIRRRDNKRKRRVEHGVVDTTVVTFKDVFYGRKGIECVECAWSLIGRGFTEPGDVPDANGLVH